MGTERYEVHRQPCDCGRGEYVVTRLEPDHPYAAGQGWWELSITCPSCEQQFSLVEQDKKVIRVRKLDIADRANTEKQFQNIAGEIKKSETFRAYLKGLEDLITSQPSVAAIYRMLARARLVDVTEQTFRKDYRQGARAWLERHIGSHNILLVLSLLGRKDEGLEAKVAEMNRLYKKSREPFVSVGSPIRTLP